MKRMRIGKGGLDAKLTLATATENIRVFRAARRKREGGAPGASTACGELAESGAAA